jgi:drug/metabolite transporter (DMT)-like permease
MAINNHRWGIAAGVLACALWGLVFLAPELTPGFTALQLSAGRYLAYGLVAAVLIAPSWRRLAGQLTGREWRGLVWLGLTGNLVYYVLLANAVQLGGVAMTSLVIGLLPVIVTVVGARDRHAVPLRRLAPSLVLSLAGLVCISWQSLATAQQPGQQSVAGLLCALGALLSWTAYVVSNSRWLGKLHAISAHEWSLLTGVVTGAMALVLAVPAFLPDLVSASAVPHVELGVAAWMMFAGVVIGVAVLCSVIGNGLWNIASRILPLTMTGQLIVFETVFAVLYGFMWEQRWPTMAEALALALLLGGVALCASAHRPPRAAPGKLRKQPA